MNVYEARRHARDHGAGRLFDRHHLARLSDDPTPEELRGHIAMLDYKVLEAHGLLKWHQARRSELKAMLDALTQEKP